MMKAIFILSDKSSGSSILFKELAGHAAIKIIDYTRHGENETLFWNKVATILGYVQNNMRYSELPLSRRRAKKDVLEFVENNGLGKNHNFEKKDELFAIWKEFCQKKMPVLIEKSPHHLHHWSALALILQFKEQNPDVDVKFIGLIRNPMDTLYSMWDRWKVPPEQQQYEWMRAYTNLERLEKICDQDIFIVKYEDIVGSQSALKQVCEFIGVEWNEGIGDSLHRSSLKKWERDKRYGFNLASNVRQYANNLGYNDNDLINKRTILWPCYSRCTILFYYMNKIKKKIRQIMRLVFNWRNQRKIKNYV